MQKFRRRLRKYVDRSQLSTHAICRQIGVAPGTLRGWIYGRHDLPLGRLWRIALVLRCTPAELVS